MMSFQAAAFRARAGAMLVVALAAALCAAAVVIHAPSARADTAPPSDTPATVSADPLPTVQQNGVIWAQVTVGNTVYAAGRFTQTWPAGAANTAANYTARANLLAFDITTGKLTAFNFALDQQALAIAASPDGTKLYVGGDFTTVNGVARNHFATFDIGSGQPNGGVLDSTIKPNVSGQVAAIAPSSNGSTVYIGGNFFNVNTVGRTRLAAISASSGGLLPWAPKADDNQVAAMVVTPDNSEIVIGGRFSSMNGAFTPGLGAVTAADGTSVPYAIASKVQDYTAPGSKAPNGSGIESLTTDGTQIYGSGYSYAEGNFEGSFGVEPDTGAINFVNDCHGDTYDVYPVGQVLYTVSHVHECTATGDFPDTNPRVNWHANAWTTYPTGTNVGPDDYGWNYNGVPDTDLLHWYPKLATGTVTGQSQAAWSVTGNSQYIALGGEFPSVNGVAQQGIVRYAIKSIAPNKVGPTPTSAITPKATSFGGGTARVTWQTTWDQDNANLTYNVTRDGVSTPVYSVTKASNFWQLPTIGFLDTGLAPGSSHTYKVQVVDPSGNKIGSSVSAPVTVASTGSSGGAYVNDVRSDGATNFWRFNEQSGSTAYDWAGFSDQSEGAGAAGGVTGPLSGDTSTATNFNGTSSGTASTTTAATGPSTFSVEAWFQTTTSLGGKIVGFGNTPAPATSGSYDRHVYMDNAGHLIYGVYNNGVSTVTSAKTYNDGRWHHVVGELSSAGMSLFVDGRAVGTNQGTTSFSPYDGYWRVGGDNLGGWPNQPASNNFAGAIADVAVYPTALSVQQVQKHYTDAGNSLPITAAPTDSYGKAVYNDNPLLYWRLDDASGSSSAADTSPFDVPGNYSGGVGYRTASPVSGSSGTGVSLNGADGLITSSQTYTNPTAYSEELWFDTTTGDGGKLIGFGDAATGLSSNYDRHVYMLNSGQLEFGTYTDQTNTIVSPKSYNDGHWHQLVATQGPVGMTLYVDGQPVGTNPQTRAQNYTGYWRVGGDNTWGGANSNYFAGAIDEVAVYGNQLSDAQVQSQYQASAAAVNPPPTAAIATPSCSNLSCIFDGTGSSASGGTITGYAWTFGDGGTSSAAKPSHSFGAAGTYPVKLVVTDSHGVTSTADNATVTVSGPAAPPAAAFTTTCPSLTCSVDASGSTGSGNFTYAWTFGDGHAASGKTSSNTYAAAGTYAVKLTVTDGNGQSDSVTHTVTPAPTGNPTIKPYATDSFNRTVTPGWGSADTGGAWSPTNSASSLSVANGSGALRMGSPGANPGAYLGGVSSTDSSTMVNITTNAPPTGNGTYLDVSGRRLSATTDYRGRVILAANGSVTLALIAVNGGTTTTLKSKALTGFTYVPGSQLQVQLVVTGTSPTTLSMKAWPVGTTQPAAWQLSASDSTAALQSNGSVGVLGYLPGNATTAPVTMLVNTFSTGPSNGLPTAAFAANCSGQTCSTDGTASNDPSGTISSYQWSWGDGLVTSGATSSHSYSAAGTYTVTLTVTDPSGYTAVATRTVVVPA